MHSRSQDKLDKDDLDKDKKEKKKEKRNSKHQEIFDKEFKSTDISLQQSEAVILSETVTLLASNALSNSEQCSLSFEIKMLIFMIKLIFRPRTTLWAYTMMLIYVINNQKYGFSSLIVLKNHGFLFENLNQKLYLTV